MRRSLGRTLIAQERLTEADSELADQIEIMESHSITIEPPPALAILGELRVRQGRLGEAEAAYLRAVTVLEADSPDDPYLGLIAAEPIPFDS